MRRGRASGLGSQAGAWEPVKPGNQLRVMAFIWVEENVEPEVKVFVYKT
jgi:hypothetical protein